MRGNRVGTQIWPPISNDHKPARPDDKKSTQAISPEEIPIEDLWLDGHAQNPLASADLKTVADVFAFGRRRILRLPNMGKKNLWKIERAIQQKGIAVPWQTGSRAGSTSELRLLPLPEKRLTVHDLPLSVRAHNCLLNAGLKTVDEILSAGPKGILHRYTPRVVLLEIEWALEQKGFTIPWNTEIKPSSTSMETPRG